MNDKTSPHLPDPDVYLGEDGTPRSRVSDDVYFSTSGGADETRHVFLGGIDAPKLFGRQSSVRIAELGFGTGLNFIVTWRDWIADAPKNATLHYTAIEGYPMSAEMLYQVLGNIPELTAEATALIAQWPPLVKGTHRLVLSGGRVHLTLIFLNVSDALAGVSDKFDAWYLDGFSPAKNPEMWTDDVLNRVRLLCTPNARIATFTAAGHVRRTLSGLGFDVQKRPGFGRKRDCISAKLNENKKPNTLSRKIKPKTVAVIGAGIAGATLANALRMRGHKPIIIDAADQVGAAASGNPVALIAPRLTRERVPMGRIIASAYLHAVRFYDDLHDSGGDPWIGARGSYVMAQNDEEAERQSRAKKAYGWPDDVMQEVSSTQASLLTGVNITKGGSWFAGSGAVSPANVIATLTKEIEVIKGTVTQVYRSDDGWHVVMTGNDDLGAFDAVCVAAGIGVMDVLGPDTFPLLPNRGQLAYVSSLSQSPDVAISYGGYVSPKLTLDNGAACHVLGASYARRDEIPDAEWETLRQSDTDAMLENFAEQLPGIDVGEVIGGRTARRATIRDYIPLAGEWDDGLFVLGGLGSRGFMTAPLLADLIADQISDAPLPLEADLVKALSPKRFDKYNMKM